MKYKLLHDYPVLMIENLFPKPINKKILEEAISLKKLYQTASTFGKKANWIRSNIVAYYDDIYNGRRQESVLLESIEKIFHHEKYSDLRDIINSSPYPLHHFNLTNIHETQVSRYGDKGQRYGWHADKGSNSERLISFVYHFFEEPAKFKGGNINFSKLPTYKDKLLNSNDDYVSFPIKNNTGYFFPSYLSHRVEPTTSPKTFKNGRFSVNCWIGMR